MVCRVEIYSLLLKFRYAPESVRRDRPVYTHKSDVWSFGICVWEILTLASYDAPYVNDDAFISFCEQEGYGTEHDRKQHQYNLIVSYISERHTGSAFSILYTLWS